MKIKKLGALLVSAALCAGMAAPGFAFEGDTTPVNSNVSCLFLGQSLSESIKSILT